MALFSTSFFAKCLRASEDGPWMHLYGENFENSVSQND